MTKTRERVKIFFIEKKWWTAALCLCLAAAMFYVVNYPAAVGASAATRQLPIYCVQRDQKLVSISFDAAWGDAILRQGNPTSIRAIPHLEQTEKSTGFAGGFFDFVWRLSLPETLIFNIH